MVVGPTDEGSFLRLKVGSIQRNRSACRVLRAGQAATLALGNFDRSLLRKVRGHIKICKHVGGDSKLMLLALDGVEDWFAFIKFVFRQYSHVRV